MADIALDDLYFRGEEHVHALFDFRPLGETVGRATHSKQLRHATCKLPHLLIARRVALCVHSLGNSHELVQLGGRPALHDGLCRRVHEVGQPAAISERVLCAVAVYGLARYFSPDQSLNVHFQSRQHLGDRVVLSIVVAGG